MSTPRPFPELSLGAGTCQHLRPSLAWCALKMVCVRWKEHPRGTLLRSNEGSDFEGALRGQGCPWANPSDSQLRQITEHFFRWSGEKGRRGGSESRMPQKQSAEDSAGGKEEVWLHLACGGAVFQASRDA